MADGSLPVNHHVQRAGREALAASLAVLAEAVAAEMAESGQRPPLFEAIRRRLRSGDLFAQPLINIRDFAEPRWLEALLALAKNQDALGDLHRRVSFDEPAVLAALKDGAAAEELARRFGAELAGWLDQRLDGIPGRPECLSRFLTDGFPVAPDSRERILPFDAWRLFFAEKAKASQEVFSILVLHALAQLTGRGEADLAGRAADFDTLLSGPLRVMGDRLERIEAGVLAVRQTQAEHTETLGGIAADTGEIKSAVGVIDTKTDGVREVVDAIHTGVRELRARPVPETTPRAKPINLPYHSRGDLFRGRDPALAALHAAFAGGAGAAAIGQRQAVHGLGGVGKTRLAVEYAHRHAEDYSALLFVEAPSPESLDSGLAGLATLLHLPEREAPEQDVRRAAVLHWLATHPGWLLILDNVDSEAAATAVEDLLGTLNGGQVLITSRLSGWSPQIRTLALDVLAEADAAAFLLSRAPRRRKTPDEAERALELARELGGLALALEQAGAYIDRQRLGLGDYLKTWRDRRDTRLPWFDEPWFDEGFNPRLNQYPRSIAVTWQASFDALSEPARRLLHRLAWLGPEPIPESLLDVPVPDCADNPGTCRSALADLDAYSLASRRDEGDAPGAGPEFAVHRLVQEVARHAQRAASPPPALTEALAWLNAAFVGEVQDVRTWPVLRPLAPHALAVAGRADDAGITKPTARLFNDLGVLFLAQARYLEAEPLMRRALAIDDASHGPEHPAVARDLNNLAQLLQATNRLTEAEPLMRQALVIDEASYGPEHPSVACVLNNLARLLQATNRLAEAEPLIRRALAIDEASFGPEHPEVATRLNNLARLLQATRRLAEAEPLLRRALSICEASYGPEHPHFARVLNNLAQLLQDANRLTEAEPLMRRALAIDEASYGPGHPNVARDLNNLAGLLQATNLLTEAEPLMRRALSIFKASYAPAHPDEARALNNLAMLLQATHRLAEAEPLSRRAALILLTCTRATGHVYPAGIRGQARIQFRYGNSQALGRKGLDRSRMWLLYRTFTV